MKVSWWSVGYWLALVAAAVLVIVIALNRNELKQSLGKQQEALDSVTRDLHRSQAELSRTKREAVATRSAALHLSASMYGAQRLLTDLNHQLDASCTGLSGDRVGNMMNFCSLLQGSSAWTQASNAVALRRAVARTSAEFGEIAAAYQHLLPQAGTVSERVAFVHEGIAYARLRQERLAEAQSAAMLARRAANSSVRVAITAIKVDCARNVAAGEIRRSVDQMRARVDAKVRRISAALARASRAFPALQDDLQDARTEQRLIEQDPEFHMLCGYAGIGPQA